MELLGLLMGSAPDGGRAQEPDVILHIQELHQVMDEPFGRQDPGPAEFEGNNNVKAAPDEQDTVLCLQSDQGSVSYLLSLPGILQEPSLEKIILSSALEAVDEIVDCILFQCQSSYAIYDNDCRILHTPACAS